MNDPQVWTTVWGLTVGAGGGMGKGGQREENWDDYNRITIKNKLKIEKTNSSLMSEQGKTPIF